MNRKTGLAVAAALLLFITASGLGWVTVTQMQDTASIEDPRPDIKPAPAAHPSQDQANLLPLLVAALHHDTNSGPAIRPDVRMKDKHNLISRLSQESARRGWYLHHPDWPEQHAVLALPANQEAALRGLEQDPGRWLQQPASPGAPWAPGPMVTYTIKPNASIIAPARSHRAMPITMALLGTLLALTTGTAAASIAWKHRRDAPNHRGQHPGLQETPNP